MFIYLSIKFFFVIKTFKIHSLGKLQICTTIPFTVYASEESFYCTLETNIMLYANHTSIKQNRNKKKKMYKV